MPDLATAPVVNPSPAPAPAPTASPAPAGQPAPASSFTMPEKFANAKPEEIARAYTELETKLGEQGKKLGTYGEYEKLGNPKELSEALQWARDTYARIQRGEYVPKGQAPAPAQNAPQLPANGPQTPWTMEGFDFLPPGEQASRIAAYNQQVVQQNVMAEVQKIAAAYGQQIEQTRAIQAREQSLLVKSIQAALANGGKVDLQKALETAAELANRPPEEIIDLAFKTLANPEEQKAEVERQVAARMAEERQKMQNESLDSLSHMSSPTPRFATKVYNTRQDENRAIMDQWQKAGIRL